MNLHNNEFLYIWNEITTEQWCDVLQNSFLTTPDCLEILKILYAAPNYRLNASKIAGQMKVKHFIELNRIVGNWGKRIAKHISGLSYPLREESGKLRCWLVVFDGADCRKPTHFDWIIKPEMQKAIQYLHLFTSLEENIGAEKRIEQQILQIQKDLPPTGEEKLYLTKHRVNQGTIRARTIQHYGCKCQLCGLKIQSLLIVSHIYPWSCSNKEEKSDINNLLLLCAQHDALFDKHLISFDENGKILINRGLDESDKRLLNINDDIEIVIPEAMKKYMIKHHEVFKEKDLEADISR